MLILYSQKLTDYPDRKSTNSRINLHPRTIGPTGHQQNISYNTDRIHILFNNTWNILQDRSYGRSQNKSQQTKKTRKNKS